MGTINSNGSATAARRVLNGRGVANRNLNKRQRAVLAADILDGIVTFQPSAKQAAQLLDVSVSYIEIAQRLSPQMRKAILEGTDSTPFAGLLDPPAQRLALPAPITIDDAMLIEMVRAVGIDRTLEAAVAVEHS